MTLGLLTSSYPRHREDTINAGAFVRDFALALHAQGERLLVFTHRKGEPGRHDEPFPVHEFRWPGRETSLTALDLGTPIGALQASGLVAMGTASYLYIARARRIDFSLAMWAVPSGLFAWAARQILGIPYAVWALGSDIWRYEGRGAMGRLLARVLADADLLYADGLDLAARVEAIAGRPCAFLPSARDLSGIAPAPVADDAPRPRFLFVGRYEENKGPDVLVEAAARYARRGGRGSFALFGAGSLAARLTRRVAALELTDRVRLSGVIGPAEMVGRLAWCDYLVIPSRIESIPVVFSDALQRGVPVIATDVGDLGALVRELGVGRVVPPADADALAQALRALDDVDPAGYREAALRAAMRFSVVESARRFRADAERRARP